MIDETGVGIWGVGTWTSTACWGRGPQRGALTIDRYDGGAYWRRRHWRTDFWLRW